MMETGPFRPDGNGGLQTIEGGWEEYTNMVFSEHIHSIRFNLFVSEVCTMSS